MPFCILTYNIYINPVHDKQDFKDDSNLFKFFPDEEYSKSIRLPNLKEKSPNFKFLESYKTKTLLLVRLSGSILTNLDTI